MKANDLKALIDKAIGKRGIIRTPAWWVRKIFYELVELYETLSDSITSVKGDITSVKGDITNVKGDITNVKSDITNVKSNITNVKSDITSVKEGLGRPFILEWTGDSVSLKLDGNTIKFNSKKHRAIGYFWKSFSAYYKENVNNITKLDLTKVCTRLMESMYGMFDSCSSLQTLDLSSFDTSKVTSMESMFRGCSSLQSLDLSGFDTSKVTSMYSMFDGCSSLQSLDLSGFDTSEVTSISFMFDSCSSLQTLDLSSFDTSKVTSIIDLMFVKCTKLTALTLSAAFFNSASLTTYSFTNLTAWTEANSLAALVKALPTITAAKTIKLSANTKAALTDEQKETITTTKGWTIA